MTIRREAEAFASAHHGETLQLLRDLAAIPAPTGREEKRAAFVKGWLLANGAQEEQVRIDRAGNVVFRLEGRISGKYSVIMAHMDTVFPDTEPLEVREDSQNMYAPGIGDNTANLVNMLMAARFLIEHPEIVRHRSILFVADTCEEGLGNLKGCRQIFADFGSRITSFIAFDLYLDTIVERAVGSRRYRITARTTGGHSLQNFGNKSAIKVLAELIVDLYAQKLPLEGKTVYNVGTIEGGTSVNAIPEYASMLYEFRADLPSSMRRMDANLTELVEKRLCYDVQIESELLGERPCGLGTDSGAAARFRAQNEYVLSNANSGELHIMLGSTDANIPLSMGIPAVTFGTVSGGNLHTRREWIEKKSLIAGQAAAIIAVCQSLQQVI